MRFGKFTNDWPKWVFTILAIATLCSHDLYLKMDSYFLEPYQDATISLYNGTFEKSENIITRDRMLDASIVSHGQRGPIDTRLWKDRDSTLTQLPFSTGAAGTYVVGVSTKARNIALTADKFNDYLKHDGVLDMLEQRIKDSVLDQDALESYQKHVKAIYQVGDAKTNDWNTVLGYPIEFVPQANPYDKYNGDTLQVQLLLEGYPLPNQLVYANHIKASHSHGHHDHGHAHNHGHSHDSGTEEGHTHTSGQQLRTNGQGLVTVDLPEEGIYYVRTIHMEKVMDSDSLSHRSKWATLTFQVAHEHGSGTHTHDHEHDDRFFTAMMVLGSLIVIGGLFLFFRKKG